jgi:hypothetical protein
LGTWREECSLVYDDDDDDDGGLDVSDFGSGSDGGAPLAATTSA